jgi:3-isopropylmalate/(R)-2-methylmalate dehydratase small subunit
MKTFGGQVLFLDRSDINTDEIIPAKYLTELTKEALQPYTLEDLKLPSFNSAKDLKGKKVIVTRSNFGCGSSREHAPWALEANGIHLVVAESFARIFRQNMYNCGMIAAEAESTAIDSLFQDFSVGSTEASVDLGGNTLTFTQGEKTLTLPLKLGGFEEALVKAGGWVEYADTNY